MTQLVAGGEKKFLGKVDTMVRGTPPSIAAIPRLAAIPRNILPLNAMTILLDVAAALCRSSHLEIRVR